MEVLLANMDKLKVLTRKIQGSIQRLETSGKNVQDAIQPIHGNSAKLQITTTSSSFENIHWSGSDLHAARYRSYKRRHRKNQKTTRYEASRRSYNTARVSAQRKPSVERLPDFYCSILRTGNLETYIASMDRTYQALGELNKSEMRANQQVVDEFNDLLRVGSQELSATFRDTLSAESRPLEPLHYITKRQFTTKINSFSIN